MNLINAQIMIPNWGTAGAALAVTIAEIVVMIMQVIFCRKYFHHVLSKLHLLRYCLNVVPAALAVASIKMMSLPVFGALVLSVLIFFSIYAILLLIEKDEIILRALDNKVTGRFLHRISQLCECCVIARKSQVSSMIRYNKYITAS